jgi:hypothetical protein
MNYQGGSTGSCRGLQAGEYSIDLARRDLAG